jgi:hypothetical protein
MIQPTFISLFIFSFIATVYGANDWSTPCLDGVCSYDLPSSAPSSGTIKIWGDKSAISDITTAAGWEILDCSPDKTQQDIRLVCTGADSTAAGCSHLFDGGANGKVVRLPESCGKNAFGRVAKSWVPADQSIPAAVASKIQRRDGQQPQVKALTLDTDFAAGGTNAGPVNFALKGANFKGAQGDIQTTPATTRRSRIYGYQTRGLFDFVGDAIDAIKGLNDFDVDKSTTLQPLSVDKSFNILDQKLSCPPLAASLKIDAAAKADATASIGVAASGTIIPPKIEDFAVIAGLKANLDGTLDMVASVTGSIDSGKVKLFETGIPGLDFPGVLTIGPTFEVNAQATANLDVQADMTIGLNFKIDNAQLVFPPSSAKAQAQGGAFNIGDTPLKLSASPSIKATGSVEAHLIPSVNLKISALGDIVDAGIFLAMDTSAKMQLDLEGQAEGDVTITPRSIDAGVLAGTDSTRSLTLDNEMRSSVKRGFFSSLGDFFGKALGGLKDKAKAALGNLKDKAIGAVKDKAASAIKGILGGNTASTAAPAATNTGSTAVKGAAAASGAAAVAGGVAAAAGANNASPASTAPVLAAAGNATAATNSTKGTTVTKSGSASFGGCFTIDAGLDVNAGADANFFGLFDKNTKVSLFKKNFELVNKCFGDKAAATKRMVIPSASRPYPIVPRSQHVKLYRASSLSALSKRALSCAAPDAGETQPVADEVVPAASAKAI